MPTPVTIIAQTDTGFKIRLPDGTTRTVPHDRVTLPLTYPPPEGRGLGALYASAGGGLSEHLCVLLSTHSA